MFSYRLLLNIIGSIFFLVSVSVALCHGVKDSKFPAVRASCANVEKDNGKNIFEILYISNVNGNIENCHCGKNPLGGLDRLAFVLEKRRSQNPQLLFIDGGDFLNTYPFPALNQTVVDIYAELKPDLLVLGDQEFGEGADFAGQIISNFSSCILATNYHFKKNPFLLSRKTKTLSGRRVVILSFLDKSSFEFREKDKDLTFDSKQFNDEYHRLNKSDIIIVIYHGEMRRLDLYPDVDLVLTAHEQSNIIQLDRRPAVIGGRADGEYLIQIYIRQNDSKIYFNANPIPLDLKTEKDCKINSIIEQFNKKQKKQKKGQ
jgi:2',3'-cyclic-nucleotide 2'-phosphodiesterase (5'-nucleotidase family)